MKLSFTIGLKVVASYLSAGAIYLLYFKWPHYEGHPHVPFSEFPEFLIFAPFVPFFLLDNLLNRPGDSAAGLLIFGAAFGCSLWIFLKKKKRAQP